MMKTIRKLVLLSCMTLITGLAVQTSAAKTIDNKTSSVSALTNDEMIAMMQGDWQCEPFFPDEGVDISGISMDTIKGNKWFSEGEVTVNFQMDDMPLVIHLTSESNIHFKDKILHEKYISSKVIEVNSHPLADSFKQQLEDDSNTQIFTSKIVSINKHQFVTRDLEDDSIVNCKRRQ